jgi:hypothetical protein
MRAPFTVIRIERPPSLAGLDLSRLSDMGLLSLDLHPSAAGPEIELTFGTAEGAAPVTEEFLCEKLEAATGLSVLASRRHELHGATVLLTTGHSVETNFAAGAIAEAVANRIGAADEEIITWAEWVAVTDKHGQGPIFLNPLEVAGIVPAHIIVGAEG